MESVAYINTTLTIVEWQLEDFDSCNEPQGLVRSLAECTPSEN
jgi:hypothetical protein